MSSCRFSALLFAAMLLALHTALASAAQLGATAQSVMPESTRQLISIDYHRLNSDPLARQLEAEVLPQQMQGVSALLVKGGVQPGNDLNRLTFATYQASKSVGLIGIAEGNFGDLQLSKFFTKTAKTPTPPQIDGVSVYTYGGLSFFVPDPSTLVFGDPAAVEQAIQTEQGASHLAQNEQLSNLIAGTQTSDVWSVLDTTGSRAMVRSMLAGVSSPISPSLIDQHFNGARYTISFQNEVQVNLELITTDALSAAAISTGLNAAIALRAHQEKDPTAQGLLNQIQVDSAGDHAFLQIAAPESTVASLMHTDVMQSILH